MGNSSSYSDYRPVKNADQAFSHILQENPNMSEDAKNGLRDLRTCIFQYLEGETNVRMDIYVAGENHGVPFKFRIGSGSEHMTINVNQSVLNCEFQRGIAKQAWKFVSGAFSHLLDVAVDAAVKKIAGGAAQKAIGFVFKKR